MARGSRACFSYEFPDRSAGSTSYYCKTRSRKTQNGPKTYGDHEMKTITLEQGSVAWLAYRRNKIGGSDAPSIMNCGYKTPYQLYLEKLGLYDQPLTNAMKRGQELEPLARDQFTRLTGIQTAPAVIEHYDRPWQIASLDGLSNDGKTFVEIKTGGDAALERAKAGKVSDNNYCQVQHQLEVTGLQKAFLFFFDGVNGYPIEINRDDNYIRRLVEAESRFWEDLQDFKAPPLTEKDKITVETEERLRMAQEWLELTERMKRDEERKKQLQESILQDSQYQNSIGCGLQCVKVVRAGAVDYSAIPELAG